ncbi:MAG: septal ring lytic transglycosylase RlpA family protein [Flavobacterium sp.]|nr:septal ring lytic transglycosylase RlpA family protein [Flavobacterium sp.]
MPLILLACHSKHSPAKSEVQTQFIETGLATYYADKFIGKPTASGQLYDANKLTAAHRTIAFGTRVSVTNVQNGKTVEVVINDRGPFVANRIIDVSKAAAQALDMLNAGVVKVRLTYR